MKSQEQIMFLITAILRDVQTLHSEVISPESLRITVRKIRNRVSEEGIGFVNKTLPRLGKAVDRALSGSTTLDAAALGFKTADGCKLPLMLGELFLRVFDCDGRVLKDPCVSSIKAIRQVLYCLYKYELPYDPETEKAVLEKFERTEEEVVLHSKQLSDIAEHLAAYGPRGLSAVKPASARPLIRKARRLLFELFKRFDVQDIVPRHGPGAVSTKEKLWGKWFFTTISSRIAEIYPIDAFFFASVSHVCDRLEDIRTVLKWGEDPARVCLVPKDSRGPRLISCEALAFQFIQQGLAQAIMKYVEAHPLTRNAVRFKDQRPNQWGAQLGSRYGTYATLDLNEASDRVSVGLVKLLFPEPLLSALLACRSLSTVLPGGRRLTLEKYAPMGSALCFPVLALTVWALLAAGSPDADVLEEGSSLRSGIAVYGDDVIVPSGYAANAIEGLETFGLKVNRDKSFTSGFFRESCGMDAFLGVPVTPVRFKTVWSSSRSPESLTAWCEYANELYKRSYFYTYELIAGWIFRLYGRIPEVSQDLMVPSLLEVPEAYRPKARSCSELQCSQYEVWTLQPRVISKEIDGWKMLHRYFTDCFSRDRSIDPPEGEESIRPFLEFVGPLPLRKQIHPSLRNTAHGNRGGSRRAVFGESWLDYVSAPYSVCSYTKPRAVKLQRRWLPECPKIVGQA